MERTGAGYGVALRPNNSLASVPGPAGLVSGGKGSGLRVPLSCAFAVPYTHVRTAHKVSAAFVTAHTVRFTVRPCRFGGLNG